MWKGVKRGRAVLDPQSSYAGEGERKRERKTREKRKGKEKVLRITTRPATCLSRPPYKKGGRRRGSGKEREKRDP